VKYYFNLKLFFEDVTYTFKNNIAIAYKDEKYSYEDLNEKANLYSQYLNEQRVKQGDVVAIASTKVFEDYALMIACLKNGITYVNLDIENPAKRIKDIFKICKPKFVFSKTKINTIVNSSAEFNIDCIAYNDIQLTTKDESLFNLIIDGDTIAYIMFTSGSSGTPKGVAITHQNVIHLISWVKNKYEINKSDRFANISPMYFDNSVFDFYGSLFNGATLVPIRKELLTQPVELIEYVGDMECTIWFSVPSMLIYLTTMRVLNESNLENIRIFTFGGEGYPKRELEKLYKLYSDRADFINVYGPTECTCICSSYNITEKDFENYDELASLGTINQNFSYVILNSENNESDLGELCLLGPNVGVGYFNDLEKTNNAFVSFNNSRHYEKKMYKTGDIVEEKNGLLFFKGRIDNQIKHMGYRIELEEIEFALNSLKEIGQSAVLYKREEGGAYGKIIAFITSNNPIFTSEIIKIELKNILPLYMVPSNIYILDRLPKNKNGKVDKKYLRKNL